MELFLDYYTDTQTAAVINATLLPGTHRIQVKDGGVFDFTLTDQGYLDYATSLDSELSGQGTMTLTVNY